MKTFRPAKKRIEVSVGESVRIVRELQGYSQNELAKRTGIPQATISAIENDRVRLGGRTSRDSRASVAVPSGRVGLPGMGSRRRLGSLTRRHSNRALRRVGCPFCADREGFMGAGYTKS